jgi:DNA-binding CsgD family transcriptional regulator/catechol 2,3-dioxygenase-like lactoylglutathione lyase family enzyme
MPNRRRRGRPPHDDVLTPAEWKVTHAVQHGMTNRAIAERSGVSRNGIKFHIANVLGKLGLTDRKALRHWFQVPKGSALEHKGAGISRTGNAAAVPRIDGEQAKPAQEETIVAFPGLGPIAQISRTVSDIQKAERWYGQVLGLRHLYTFGNLAFFDCGGTRLFLSQEAASPTSESIIYFRVDDIEGAHKTLVGKGVEFTNAPHMIHRHSDGTEEWLAVFKDLEGRPLAIMAQVRP